MARNDGSMTTEDGDVMVDVGDLCRIEQLPWTLITYPYTFNPVCEGNSWVHVNLLAEKLSEAPRVKQSIGDKILATGIIESV